MASLAIPQLDLWHHPSKASWWAPIERERLSYEKEDPLGLQIANFCGVIRGTAELVVSGREGLKTPDRPSELKCQGFSASRPGRRFPRRDVR